MKKMTVLIVALALTLAVAAAASAFNPQPEPPKGKILTLTLTAAQLKLLAKNPDGAEIVLTSTQSKLARNFYPCCLMKQPKAKVALGHVYDTNKLNVIKEDDWLRSVPQK